MMFMRVDPTALHQSGTVLAHCGRMMMPCMHFDQSPVVAGPPLPEIKFEQLTYPLSQKNVIILDFYQVNLS